MGQLAVMVLQLTDLVSHLGLYVGTQQEQHFQYALIKQGLGDAGIGGLGDLERDPAGDHHLDGLTEIRQILIIDVYDATLAQAFEQGDHGGAHLLLGLEVLLLELLVAAQDVRQVGVEEAELPHQVEDGIQIAHQILQGNLAVARRDEALAQVAGILIEDGVDDVFFIAEVVIEVARADAQVRRNVVGGDVGLTLIVEQLGRAVNDPVSGFHHASLLRDSPGSTERGRIP